MTEKNVELFEDHQVEIDGPYNTPMKQFFNTDLWDVRILNENGAKPIIRIRRKEIMPEKEV